VGVDPGTGLKFGSCHTTSARPIAVDLLSSKAAVSGTRVAVVDVFMPASNALWSRAPAAVNKASGVAISSFAALMISDPTKDMAMVFDTSILDVADAVAAADVVNVDVVVVTVLDVITCVAAVEEIVDIGGGVVALTEIAVVVMVVVVAVVANVAIVSVVVAVAVVVEGAVVVQGAVAGGFDCLSKFPPQHKAVQSDRRTQLL